jgi:tetratricopeptide (TPR) repeat protein
MIELLLQAEGALSVGLLDRAETLYRQVANADPRNAIAIVGLSRVALERGQQPAALELARRALAIDRENVAAQRMVQRLEEVLAFQGIDVTRTASTTAAPKAADLAPTPPKPEADASEPRGQRSIVDRLLRRR